MRALILATVMVVLAGCGGELDVEAVGSTEAPPPSSSEAPATTTTAPPATTAPPPPPTLDDEAFAVEYLRSQFPQMVFWDDEPLLVFMDAVCGEAETWYPDGESFAMAWLIAFEADTTPVSDVFTVDEFAAFIGSIVGVHCPAYVGMFD